MSVGISSIINKVQELSHDEKEELKFLLERYLIDEKRETIFQNYQESLNELHSGQLKFSSDIDELKKSIERWSKSHFVHHSNEHSNKLSRKANVKKTVAKKEIRRREKRIKSKYYKTNLYRISLACFFSILLLGKHITNLELKWKIGEYS